MSLDDKRPLPVDVLMNAKQDNVHRDPGEVRAMTIDDLRAKEEEAKKWRPRFICDIDDFDHAAWNCARASCGSCLGAQRAVEDVARHVESAMARLRRTQVNRRWEAGDKRRARESAHRAARIEAYFGQPGPVAAFRDAVAEFVR